MRHLVFFVAACAACARQPVVPSTQTTAAAVTAPPVSSRDVRVSRDIVRRCAVRIGDRAPEFAFDGTTLDGQGRDLLAQVAKCLVTGPLAGRAVRIVGHTDARGEPEYNMTLGAVRAESAADFLIRLGVSPGRILPTSRGELDATGADEPAMQRDRRVDVEVAQ
ncbi:MAG TPA: OmpA family protein [Polyangiaceae bacterium]|jgi:peptidoglycan-associated lipoprotein